MTAPAIFKQSDVTRAVKGVLKAEIVLQGFDGKLEMLDGKSQSNEGAAGNDWGKSVELDDEIPNFDDDSNPPF